MEKDGEKDLNGLLNAVRNVKTPKTVIKKRLEAGRTIQLDLKTKAQLLTIISGNEENKGLTLHQIIGEGQTLKIVITAKPFEPEVLIYVFTAEKH